MSFNFIKNKIKKGFGKIYSYDKIACILRQLCQKDAFPKILTFHRIINPEDVSYPIEEGMYVRPDNFNRIINYLSNEFEIISVDELISRIAIRSKLNSKTVVLTFDDGWRDNYLNAFPILKSHNIPATIFLPTFYINKNDLFWTDKLIIHHFLSVGTAHSKVLSPSTQKMILKYKNYNIDKINNFIKELEKKNGDIYPKSRSFLNWDEIIEMSGHNISFGSHSHQHHNLTKLSNEEITSDIKTSLATLKKENIPFLNTFCYPGGYHNSSTQGILKQFGFNMAFITIGFNDLSSYPQVLSRINIHDDISKTNELLRYAIGI